MSYDFLVYTRRDRFPAPDRLVEELRSHGLAMPPSLDLIAADGYVPIADTGFEVCCADLTSAHVEEHQSALREAGEPDDDHLAILRASDLFISFGCHDEREIATAKLVAGAIAKLSNGYVCNPQIGEVVHADYLLGEAP
jgi:hypothetical protein